MKTLPLDSRGTWCGRNKKVRICLCLWFLYITATARGCYLCTQKQTWPSCFSVFCFLFIFFILWNKFLDACDFAPFISKPTLCQTEPHKDWDGWPSWVFFPSYNSWLHDYMVQLHFTFLLNDFLEVFTILKK